MYFINELERTETFTDKKPLYKTMMI